MIVPQIQAVRTRVPKWVNVKKLLEIAKNLNPVKSAKLNPRVPELNPPGVFLNNLSITKVPNLYERHVPYTPTFGLLSERTPNTWADKAAINKLASELRKFASKNGVFDAEIFYIGIPKRGSNPFDNTQMIKEAEFKINWKDLNGSRLSIITTASFDNGGNFLPPSEFKAPNGKKATFTKENIQALAEGRVFDKPFVEPPVRELQFKKPDFTRMYRTASKKAAHTTGDQVEHAGMPAEIVADHGDGTYDVKHENGEVHQFVPGTALTRILPNLPTPMAPKREPSLQKGPMWAKKISKLSFRDADSLVPFAEDKPEEKLALQTDVEPDYSTPLRESDQGWGISKGPRGLKNDSEVGKIERDIGTGVSTASLPELSLRKTAAPKLYELPIDELRTRIFDFAKRAKMPLAFNLRDIYSLSKDQLMEVMQDMFEYNYALASKIFGIEKTGEI